MRESHPALKSFSSTLQAYAREMCAAAILTVYVATHLLASPAFAMDASKFQNEPAQRLVFWNARNQLREQNPSDVIRLWILHNSLAANGLVSTPEEEAHFRSALWVALGDMGYCPDGLAVDEDAAGIWTLAMFNWMLRAYGKDDDVETYEYWNTFEAGIVSRPVSLFDVLDAEEIRTFYPHREKCYAELTTMLRLKMSPFRYPNERYLLGEYLRHLLLHALKKLNPTDVEGISLLQVRLFDLNAEMVRMVKRRMQQNDDAVASILRQAGFGEAQIDRYRLRQGQRLKEKEESELWRRALGWPVREWMNLSPKRRISLFRDLDHDAFDEGKRDELLMGILDALIEKGLGRELQGWMGFAAQEGRKERFEKRLFDGERGKKMLALTKDGGFVEHSVVALYRGIYEVQRGEKLAALRSFAFAINASSSSVLSSEVHAISLRWFSFILSRYETTDDVLEIVRSFISKEDARSITNILLWRAALHRDEVSFRRILAAAAKTSRLNRLVKDLEGLIGENNESIISLGDAPDSPGPTRRKVRFVQEYIDRLSLEPVDVRAKHTQLLESLRDSLQEKAEGSRSGTKKAALRVAQEVQIHLDALGRVDESAVGQARASALDWSAYAGSVRLAPADEVPWPFKLSSDRAPSAFRTLRLTPIEWRDENQELVYGWRIHE